jgi:AbrB family looped-hinge helix DNA binding protein
MATSTMTSKGQITLPKPVRQRLGLRKGSRVEFLLDGDNKAATMRPMEISLSDVYGMLSARAPEKPASIGEMRQAVRAAIKRRAV